MIQRTSQGCFKNQMSSGVKLSGTQLSAKSVSVSILRHSEQAACKSFPGQGLSGRRRDYPCSSHLYRHTAFLITCPPTRMAHRSQPVSICHLHQSSELAPGFTLGALPSMALDRCNQFLVLQVYSMSSPLSLPTPRSHWSSDFLHGFAFSRCHS